MSTVAQRASRVSLALIALGVITPQALVAQLASSRPASVGLTVVVPPHAHADAAVASEGSVSLLRTTPTSIDLETTVGLANWPPARIEVRLGATWRAESTRVWVRNGRGQFERLLRDTSVVALDALASLSVTPSALRFRVESSESRAASPLLIPLEYRLKVGSSDQFSVWSFPSLLRVDAADGARH